MAGKSTYLRTIGVNYVLACTGCPVCCSSLETVSYTHLDVYKRQEEDICRIKQKVQKLGIQKTVLQPYIRKQRETFPRASEPWCTEEKEIICELMQKTNHLSIFIECLQRTGQTIQIPVSYTHLLHG